MIDTKKNNDLNYILKTLLAGGIAGSIAKTFIGPFDRIKILFQVGSPHISHYSGKINGVFSVIREIYRCNGIYGLYRGHAVMLLRIFPYSGINFMAYEQYKKILYSDKNSKFQKLLAGSLAGATSVFFTYPFDIMRSRLAYNICSSSNQVIIDKGIMRNKEKMLSSSNNMNVYRDNKIGNDMKISLWKDTFNSLIEENNSSNGNKNIRKFRNVYQGFVPTFLGIIPYSGVSFFTYEMLRNNIYTQSLLDSNVATSTLLRFTYGLIAGITGQTISYPFDIIRRKMQLNGVTKHLPAYSSIYEIAKYVYKTQGLKGFFVGLSINYLKVAPSTAISFVTFDYFKYILGI